MRGRQLFAAAAVVCAAVMTGSLATAQTAQPKWFVLHQEVVRPSMTKQYEDAAKELIALVRQHHDASPLFNFVGVADTDFVYSYVTSIASFNDIGAINAGFEALAKAAGEAKWGEVMKRGGDATVYARESILMEDPSLSYTPAKPRLKPEEEQYLHVDLYFVLSGREAEANDVAKAFAELFRKKNIPDSYRLFTVVMGPEMPLIVVTTPAKSPADYEAREAEVRQALGAEGQALFERAFSLTRRFEMHGGWIRPDLSLEPAGMPK